METEILPFSNTEQENMQNKPECSRSGMPAVKTLSLDLETSGLSWLRDKIYFIGYRLNAQGPVVQIPPNDYEQDETFRSLLADPKVTKRGHNVRFDLHFLRLAGYEINGPFDDTQLLAYLENPFRSTSLKDLVEEKLGRKVVRMDDFAVKPKKKELDTYVNSLSYYQIDNKFYEKEKMLEYNKADVVNCDDLRKDTIVSDWYKNVENPVLHLIYGMEARGIQLDIGHLKGLKKEYEQTLQDIEKGFEGVNLRSGRQVGAYLAKNGIKLTEKTENGTDKTDKLVLKRLLWAGSELVRPILQYRELSKMLSTYVKPLLDESDKQGRVHGSFNQAGRSSSDGESTSGTRTGRMSSSNPNLQNIPTRTEEGKKIRQAFIPTSGYTLFESDLSQIEPRIVAHYTQNKFLLEAYAKKIDTHAIMGGIIFGKSPDSLTELERFIGKTSWLAAFYGCSYKKLKVIADTQSEQSVPFGENYFKTVAENLEKGNPELYAWRRQHVETTRQTGYIETIGGRIIRVPNLNSKDRYERFEAERQAINYQIQGSAADVIKLILARFKSEFEGIFGYVLATVHDSVLGEVSNLLLASSDIADLAIKKKINDIMTTTVKLKNVAVECKTKFGNNWAECK